jgi:type IV pilus assembly protein PilQ
MKKQLYVLIGVIALLTVPARMLRAQNPPASAPPTAPAAPTPTDKPATPAAAAVATPATPAVPAPAKDPVKPVEEEEPALGVWDYKDADLRTVLNALAMRAGVNLIIGDGVTGMVNVSLKNMLPMDALRLIADSKGFIVREEKNVVRVLTKEAAEVQPTQTRVFTLSYAKAGELVGALESAIGKQGKAKIDQRTNSIVLTDTAPNLEKAATLIQTLDTQTPQVLIETKFFETSRDVGKVLGIDWNGVLLGRAITFDPTATVSAGGGTTTAAPGFSITKHLPLGLPSVVIGTPKASLVLDFFNSDSDSDLLASPRIVALDNTKARISIGDQIPVPSLSYSESKGAYVVTGFEWKDVGTVLTVTPHINKDGFITLEVTPEVNKAGARNFDAGGVTLTSVNTKTASTVVLIKSGNTLVIGGLTSEDVTDSFNKVPLMGDIPAVGALFRHKSLKKTKRNLVVFVTPTLVKPDMNVVESDVTKPMQEQIYTNDKWMPKDNAKPRSAIKSMKSLLHADPSPVGAPAAPAQNFGPKQ